MEKNANLAHWENWASEYGTELRATTKCLSIKRLEIEALLAQIRKHVSTPKPVVLEIGCGNGVNGIALVSRHPDLHSIGLDFSPRMIVNAVQSVEKIKESSVKERLSFGVADAQTLRLPLVLDATGPHFAGSEVNLPARGVDVVFTDRMLINLSSAEEQLAVMRGLAGVLAPDGVFLMLENSQQLHGRLTKIREALGLPPRPAASYNIFIDEDSVIRPFQEVMRLIGTYDLSSMHDLMLYAVEPSLNGGEVQYDSPLMTRLTDAILALSELGVEMPGFGQNRLWIWKK